MAKAKSGGTRSYLRGKIANDVYSIGKDGKGKKQQVVRSLAESVKNPQTQAQMFGRMVMSTVMQAKSALAEIIDHSFDGIANGQPSISEFVRRNYALVAADAKAHPASGNSFGLNKYQEKGAKGGNWVISDGDEVLPDYIDTMGGSGLILTIAKASTVTTAGAVRELLGLGSEDYITSVGITRDGGAEFFRIKVSSALADDTELTSENVAQLFNIESNAGQEVSVDVAATGISIYTSDASIVAYGSIITRHSNGTYTHSACALYKQGTPTFNADTALPTYPIGEERFLNGGEL